MNMKTGKGWVDVGNAVIADQFFQDAMAVSYHWFLAVAIISNSCGYSHHDVVLWFYFPGSGAVICQINAEKLQWGPYDFAEDCCGEGPFQSAFLPSRGSKYHGHHSLTLGHFVYVNAKWWDRTYEKKVRCHWPFM